MTVTLDDFAGADDDEKLDKATAASAWLDCTFDRPLRFKRPRPPWKGILQGRGRGTPVVLDFDSRTSGIGWIHAKASFGLVKQMQIRDVQFVGNGEKDDKHPALFTQDAASPGFQQLITWNLISKGLLGTYGTAAQKLLLTACSLDGPECDINNGWGTNVHVGGSDNVLWTCGLLLDSPSSADGPGHEPGTAGPVPHMKINYLDKSRVGRVYTTAAGRWQALDFDGQAYNSGSSGGNGGPVVFDALVLEGRNKDKPGQFPEIVVRGGQPTFRELWWGYGAKNHDPVDVTAARGAMECLGGLTRLVNPTYGNAAGVPPDFPALYASGAGTEVTLSGRAAVGSQAGKWPNPKLRYRAVNYAVVQAGDAAAAGSWLRV